MTPERFSQLCASAVLYSVGSQGKPVIAGGIKGGIPWVLLPSDEATVRVLPVANLKAADANGGIQWSAGDRVLVTIVPLSQCEEFPQGEAQASIDEQREYFLAGGGKNWLNGQLEILGEPIEWTGPGSI